MIVDDQTRPERFQSVTFVRPPVAFVAALRSVTVPFVQPEPGMAVNDALDCVDDATGRSRGRSLVGTRRQCAITALVRQCSSWRATRPNWACTREGPPAPFTPDHPERRCTCSTPLPACRTIAPRRHRCGEFACPLEEVKKWVGDLWVEFHPGLFPATTAGLEDSRFCFVHLNADCTIVPVTRWRSSGRGWLPAG